VEKNTPATLHDRRPFLPDLEPVEETNEASLSDLPAYRTAQPLHQADVLRWQRQHGNAYAQRQLLKRQAATTPSLTSAPHTIQRVMGPPYPFEGIISTRWNAALRRTPSSNGRWLANLDKNSRVTATGNTGQWLEVQTTINGVVETGFVSQELVSNIAAPGFAPALNAGGREEVTDFGAYNVYGDMRRGGLQRNELYEAEFRRLQTAWTRVNDNTGGLVTNGTAADVAAMRRTIGGLMARSQTFRNLIMEITADAGHPVTINVGRNNAYWVDEFATNRVDLTDTAYFDPNPRPGYEWASTQGELIIHWLTERRHAARQGGGFPPAHAAPLAAGGTQQQFRADIGQAGRIVSQVRDGPAGGLHAGVYTDNAGNILRIRRDGSGGNPVPYEMRYEPTGGGAVAVRRNRVVIQVSSNSPTAEALHVRCVTAAHNVSSPNTNVSAGTPLNFTTPLGGLVPAGASIAIQLFKEGVWLLPDSILGIVAWAHPFEANRTVVTSGGVNYTVSVQLQMDP
jgi:hypothetical protein